MGAPIQNGQKSGSTNRPPIPGQGPNNPTKGKGANDIPMGQPKTPSFKRPPLKTFIPTKPRIQPKLPPPPTPTRPR